jgi:hypothetical protein
MCGEQQEVMSDVFQSTDAITHIQKNHNVPFLPPFCPPPTEAREVLGLGGYRKSPNVSLK